MSLQKIIDIVAKRHLFLIFHYTDNINDWQIVNICTLQELCKMRDGIVYSDLSSYEMQLLIDYMY